MEKHPLFFSALSFCGQAQRHHRGGGVHRCGVLSLCVWKPQSFRNDQLLVLLMLLSCPPQGGSNQPFMPWAPWPRTCHDSLRTSCSLTSLGWDCPSFLADSCPCTPMLTCSPCKVEQNLLWITRQHREEAGSCHLPAMFPTLSKFWSLRSHAGARAGA